MAKTILIIDDDKDWVWMLGMWLQHEGYHAESAFDAVQAITQTINLKPDLIILDIIMPAGDGVGVLEKLRANANTINIPVVVVTAIKDSQTKEDAEKLGISGYLVKPVEIEELMGKLKKILIEK